MRRFAIFPMIAGFVLSLAACVTDRAPAPPAQAPPVDEAANASTSDDSQDFDATEPVIEHSATGAAEGPRADPCPCTNPVCRPLCSGN